MGGRGGGAERRRLVPTAARRRGSPEFTEISAPGVKSARVLAGEGLHSMCNPLVALAGLEGARGSESGGGGSNTSLKT